MIIRTMTESAARHEFIGEIKVGRWVACRQGSMAMTDGSHATAEEAIADARAEGERTGLEGGSYEAVLVVADTDRRRGQLHLLYLDRAKFPSAAAAAEYARGANDRLWHAEQEGRGYVRVLLGGEGDRFGTREPGLWAVGERDCRLLRPVEYPTPILALLLECLPSLPGGVL